MHFVKISACAAAMAFGLGLAAASAADTQVANVGSCLKLSSQVRSALDSNQQAANYDAAKKEGGFGRDYCTNGFYAQGIAHYERALQLLGVPMNTAQQN